MPPPPGSAPVSVDDELGVPGLTMGPGIGIQIGATGKLLAMGRGYAQNDAFSAHDVVIASGAHKLGDIPPTVETAGPDEDARTNDRFPQTTTA